MDRLFVIDASAYLYSAYFAIRNMTNSKGESTNALFGFARSLQKIIKDFKPTHLVAVFDGPQGTQKRKEIYSDYKAHRQATPDDLRYQIDRALKLCELMGIPLLNVPAVEADDTIGSIACWARDHGDSVYLCSGDKDLCQLVDDKVSILNTAKDNLIIGPAQVEEIYGIPPDKMIDYLAIVGDASDNVPGLPGFGPKTAVKYIKQFGSLDNMLNNAPAISEPKKRETAVVLADQARLSRELVTIDCAVEIPLDPNFYAITYPDLGPLRDFYASMNFQSLIKDLDSLKQPVSSGPEGEYILVDDQAAVDNLLRHLSTVPEIAFTLETTSLQPMQGDFVGIGLACKPEKAWYIPLNGALGKEKVLNALRPFFANPSIKFYAHNSKFDLHLLANEGIIVSTLGFDTLLASYLLNSQSRQHSLEALILEQYNRVKTTIKDLTGKGKDTLTLQEVPIEKMTAYCCEDVDFTSRLKQHFADELEKRGMNDLFYQLELPLLRVLEKMERTGIYLDVPKLQAMSQELTASIAQLQQEIYALAGEEFNINSPKQLIAIFQKLGIKSSKKTSGGQMRTDSDVLEELRKNHEIAGKLLEYRGLEKLRSTYVDSLPTNVNPRTGRIHCTFNQSVAATGRLSCQDPNLQNIPIRSEMGRQIREAFRPERADWSYLAADYSQIELRLLAHFSEDPNLLWAFTHGEDVHTHTASIIFNTPLNEVSKEMRQQAKAVNFGVIYGQQAFGLAQELGIEVKVAAEFIEMYFQRYQRVREFIEETKATARKTGKTVTLTGRERPITEINSKNVPMRLLAERLAVNTPLQGTAADIIKLAMLECDRHFTDRNLQGKMILQIHDELIFELPDIELPVAEALVRQAMEGVMKLKIPLIVDISIGKNWNSC